MLHEIRLGFLRRRLFGGLLRRDLGSAVPTAVEVDTIGVMATHKSLGEPRCVGGDDYLRSGSRHTDERCERFQNVRVETRLRLVENEEFGRLR